MPFKLTAPYSPAGDQPKAIDQLILGLKKGFRKQTLLGVTGSGKTFTIANVIQEMQMPTLVIAHNKTLAAQLCNEFREFFPESAVEYFVSYYDYYQPEAYMPASDTYIEKEAQINEEIDRLRHAATSALLSRRDVIIVASVSAIYGLGSPKEYEKIVLHLSRGQALDRRALAEQLIAMHFERTGLELRRGLFRLHGQILDIMPVNEQMIYRFEIGDSIERIERIDPVTRQVKKELDDAWFFPAKHYIAGPDARATAIAGIRWELEERLIFFQKRGDILEAERLKRRVRYDLELIQTIGYCNGIENYSRHFDGRVEGEPPFTLLDYFRHGHSGENNSRFLTIIDESHVTVSQIRGMYAGDRARKDTLVEHGFRLPSARDNRPLTFDEFEARAGETIYVSATPGEFELRESAQVAEQVVRPTGLVDPEVIVRPITEKRNANGSKIGLSQIEDLIIRIEERIRERERVLVTTLTKKMAEDLTEYLKEKKIRVAYVHSDVDTLERIDIIAKLRRADFDVLVGVNLLREGLDMPEVSLVAILDADKEGFLRSATSLIQTMGRAARNANGQVVLYADEMTGSIENAIKETRRRREIQLAYNKEHGITPKTIEKNIRNILEEFGIGNIRTIPPAGGTPPKAVAKNESTKDTNSTKIVDLDIIGDARTISEIMKEKTAKMKEAAKNLEFELAAILRDEIVELKKRMRRDEKKKK